ncbi:MULTISPECIES: bifunctional ornithine acetyltransferase/N-acetylglutamate synthase [unclassified Bacillus (in: firmicutes)]|uniref:bifunctional ornithine acetyltransferase/N-acetylglutamate synthase n=1 Tax=unclassified Bacillus (in: firmicutes) TaxID=185979 RepID=UPI0008E56C70|nr:MULTISPECIES: bifunctional ornithine acetyltransferase/N-acetylglutamate synthase [unclassified Bacillus (in: firmicutes)]SFA78874.1 glutamate N-acetyltransferase [Bacillus sp. UNCCL13]SFQ68804.1 glutamate N-acetyltransferase [Bacillus sp. cl95]
MQATNSIEITNIKSGSIITPKGFLAAGTHAGLRYSKKDLGVIISEVPAISAAVYTTSHFQAPPLKVTQDSLAENSFLQAVIVNSACANACTGEQGLKDAYQMRLLAAQQFNLIEDAVAVASTGVIGEFLKMDKIEIGITELLPNKELTDAEDFQTAIMTTDLVMKKCCYSTVIGGKTVTMGGAAKGSGMIHPNMATMLGFVTTDAAVHADSLKKALQLVTGHSFNQITVDGDTSTNDMVIVMANGLAENPVLDENSPDWVAFVELLAKTCQDLAKQIARDGEGATKLIEVNVKGAKDDEQARAVAKTIVGSNLVKTAVHGADANWGRIIGAIGASSAEVNPEIVDISLGEMTMLKKSEPQAFSEEEATAYLNEDTIKIHVDLHLGNGIGLAWGCDLSYDYVKINANYRT